MKATDTSGSELNYSIKSDIFHVDAKSGSVYLIAWLEPSADKRQRYEYVEILVSDESNNNKLSIRNRIVILNVNSQPPEFVAPANTYFELLEVFRQKISNLIENFLINLT